MGERKQFLPNGWAGAILDEVAIVKAGNPAPQGEESFFEGKYPFVRVLDMGRLGDESCLRLTRDQLNDEGVKGLKLCKKGSVLFTKSGASTLLNQRAILGQDSYIVSHIGVAIPKDDILSEWVYYWLKIIDFANYAHGGNMPSLPLSKAKGFEIPVAPNNEQQRIVDRIEQLFSDLDEGEALLKTVQKQLATYRQSVLKAAVTGELTKDWRKKNKHRLESGEDLLKRILKSRRENWKGRGKYKEPKAPKTTNFPDLPDGWAWGSPEQLASTNPNSLCIGPFGSNLKVSDYKQRGIPLIFVRHIRAKNFDGLSQRYVSPEKGEELSSHVVIGGDLLITKMGAPPGDVCIYPEERGFAIITADCIRFSIHRKFLSVKYFELAISSDIVQRQLQAITKGVAQQKVTLSSFKIICIPFPSSEEQEEIVDRVSDIFSQIDALEDWCATELARSNTLRQSVLKDAFSGKLVAQDPDDEPASELLKRIQAERAEKQVKVKQKSKASKSKKKRVA